MELRQYQIEAVNKVRQSYQKGHKNIILRLDCGSGKTAIAAYMCIQSAKKGNEILFLVHRKELLDQTYETFEMFDDYFIYKDKIKIGMVLSVGNRLNKYNPDFIIADECNFSMAKSWRKVINNYPSAWVLGLSATPTRLDGKSLGDIYDDLIEVVDSQWLIDNNYLCDYDYYAPHITHMEYKLKGVDYDLDDVTAQLLKSKIYGDIKKYIDYNKKTIIYCPSVEFSSMLEQEIGAVHFDANTPKNERKIIIDKFRKGEIKILTNVDLISFGFDVPDCDTVILLRPTLSLSLYIQQSMRCLRPAPGKHAIIYDLVGNCYRHGLPTEPREWSLTKDNKVRNASGEEDVVVRRCHNCELIYSGTASVCPYCGHDNGKTHKQLERDKAVELERIEAIERKKAKREVGMARSLDDLIAIGKQRGYKNPRYWAMMILNSRKSKI